GSRMTHEQVSYFIGVASCKWNGRPRRQCAEDAWYALFSLRAMEDLLPAEIRNEFLVLWSEYGGFSPSDVTKPKLAAWLDGLCESQLMRLEQRTIELLAHPRAVGGAAPLGL